jgi:hypothetical protein
METKAIEECVPFRQRPRGERTIGASDEGSSDKAQLTKLTKQPGRFAYRYLPDSAGSRSGHVASTSVYR